MLFTKAEITKNGAAIAAPFFYSQVFKIIFSGGMYVGKIPYSATLVATGGITALAVYLGGMDTP